MGTNNYTENFDDGVALTEAQLRTAYQTLTLDIANTTQMTLASSEGTFLKSNGSGVAASFSSVPDPLGPFAIRNYGLSASAAAGVLTVALKTNASTDPTGADVVDVTFSSNSTTSATYSSLQVNSALSLSVVASACLGMLTPAGTSASSVFNTSATNVYVYAINNSGIVNLAVSLKSDFDRGGQVTTTALSATADNSAVLYSSASVSVVPRLLGWVTTAIDSTGNWQLPTKVAITNTDQGLNAPAAQFSPLISLTSTSSALVTISSLALPLTTSGRVVELSFVGAATPNTGAPSHVAIADSSNEREANIAFYRDSTLIDYIKMRIVQGSGATNLTLPPSAFRVIDTPPPGNYTYSIKADTSGAGTGGIVFTKIRLFAREI